ncbi:uncharacterized protein L201_000470 [Kwoniella dendrophila CBS 6074]|uniref:PPM-type phosphatase domain-containing protein n=1 Tax=Kwoniella dendrophila CBS 6074 TaxID=1295534 RepID=A0AAX4JJL7_9TREE
MLSKFKNLKYAQLRGFKDGAKWRQSKPSINFSKPNIDIRSQITSRLKSTSQNYKYLGLGLGMVVAGGVAYYSLSKGKFKDTTLFSGAPAKIRTIPADAVELTYILDSANDPWTKNFKHLILSEEEVETKLHAAESKIAVNRINNPVKGWDASCLPSVDLGEDRFTADVVSKEDLKNLGKNDDKFFWLDWWNVRTKLHPKKEGNEILQGDGTDDLLMFSVLDGHGGPGASNLLKKTLHGCLAWNAARFLFDGLRPGQNWESDNMQPKLEKGIKFIDQWMPDFNGKDNPQTFAEMIALTFLAVDADLIQTTHQAIFNPLLHPKNNNSNLPPHSPTLLNLENIYEVGSCAITAIIDVSADKLYVANIGDTRAVAGWWNPHKEEWRCDILTEDSTGENPTEVARVISEHPEDEKESAMHNKGFGDTPRVLGGLQPTRAFGDNSYKIDHEEYKEIERALLQREPGKKWIWSEECPNKTPPYITAKPEVIVRDIHPNSGEQLRFVVLATDGLWDRLSSEDAPHLLAGHHTHHKYEDIPKTEVMANCPHAPSLPQGIHPYPKEDLSVEGKWVFEDENSATHLIRNAYGGDDRELRRQFLSMKSPGARSIRDDTTAMVIWFHDVIGETARHEEDARADTIST